MGLVRHNWFTWDAREDGRHVVPKDDGLRAMLNEVDMVYRRTASLWAVLEKAYGVY